MSKQNNHTIPVELLFNILLKRSKNNIDFILILLPEDLYANSPSMIALHVQGKLSPKLLTLFHMGYYLYLALGRRFSFTLFSLKLRDVMMRLPPLFIGQ